MPATFLFATCRPGSESALKKEVAGRHGSLLSPAFMRPQLITWKVQREDCPADFRVGGHYPQVSGTSLGMARTVQEVATLGVTAEAVFLQVFPRETPEEGVPEAVWARVDRLKGEIEQAMNLPPEAAPKLGQRVLDVIVGGEDEPYFVGSHRHQPEDFAQAAGLFRKVLPPEAPSRAWLKMEQALTWREPSGGLAGKTVLELGSAPGGASLSMLNRGATVYGVDTGAMDERVLAHPQFHHLRVAAGDLRPAMVPEQVDLLVSDMNLEPRVVYQYVEKFASRLKPLGLILTLKINSAAVEAELPSLIHKLRQWAPGPVHLRQLPANRQEVTLVSWA